MSSVCKSESGAQLLARLGTRPSLKGLEPALFGSKSAQGEVVELFGGDAAGKTELLLHLVASAVLPATWKSYQLRGQHAEVIWVDMDLKFSVLRLAVIIEQRIVTELQQNLRAGANIGSTGDDHVSGADQSCAQVSVPVSPLQHGITLEANATLRHHTDNMSQGNNKSYYISLKSERQSSEINSGDNYSARQKRTASQMNDDDCSGSMKSKSNNNFSSESGMSSFHSNSNSPDQRLECALPSSKERRLQHEDKKVADVRMQSMITDEEVERLVQQCLDRVHIVHCASSQQLLCTLHSLDATVAANMRISLLVVDPISAYFWSDKNRDLNRQSSYLHNTIYNIANILKKFSKVYNLLVIASKQALMKPKQRDEKAERTGTLCQEVATPQSDSDVHVEFLGKPWSELISRRFICAKNERGRHKMRQQYRLVSNDELKYFVINENGVEFVE